MTGSTTTPGGDRVTSLVSIRNKNSENPNNFVVLSVEHGCGGYERRCSFSAPFREGDVVSKKLESDHVRPVGSELRTRLRDRVGGTALTDLYATGTCISEQKQTASRQRSRVCSRKRRYHRYVRPSTRRQASMASSLNCLRSQRRTEASDQL